MKKTVLLFALGTAMLAACNSNPGPANQNETTATTQDTVKKQGGTVTEPADTATGKKEKEEDGEKDKDD